MTTGKVGESWTVGRLDGFSGASLIWEVEQSQRGGNTIAEPVLISDESLCLRALPVRVSLWSSGNDSLIVLCPSEYGIVCGGTNYRKK